MPEKYNRKDPFFQNCALFYFILLLYQQCHCKKHILT